MKEEGYWKAEIRKKGWSTQSGTLKRNVLNSQQRLQSWTQLVKLSPKLAVVPSHTTPPDTPKKKWTGVGVGKSLEVRKSAERANEKEADY